MSAFSNLAKLIKKDFLDSGDYAVSSRLPTIRELAVKYGYSTPTVGKSIDLLVKQGWLNKSQGSGIYIEALPKSTRELRIGFIASTLDVKLAHDCLRGVNYTVIKNNNILEVADSNYSVEEEYKQVSRMHERGLDGIVLYCLDRMNASGPEYLGCEFRDMPIVVVDLYVPEMNRPHVVFDNFSVGREMTQYLLREGRRNIAFLKFSAPHSAVDERFAGYKRAMSDAGLENCVMEFDPRSSHSNEDLLEIFGKIFSGKNVPDAIELPCDSVFVQVLPLLSKIGISVPGDVILTGNDNLCQFHGGYVWPTTNPDFARMGERAAELLLKCIKSNSQKETEIVLPCSIMTQHLVKKTNTVQSVQQNAVEKIKGRLSVLRST